MSTKLSTRPRRRSRAVTLVELMATLIIFALISTAAMSLMGSSANTQRYVLNNTTSVSQTELAFRRIVENLRSASQAACPSSTEIDLVTQPDTSKPGNPVYNIKYTLVGSQLLEIDDRYGTNVLVSSVSNFNVVVAQSTKPTMFQVTLTTSPKSSPSITRQAYVTSRNF